MRTGNLLLWIMAGMGTLLSSCDKSTDPVKVRSVKLNRAEATLIVSEHLTLEATVLPENADNKTVKWQSGNDKIATVDAAGNVTAVAAGETAITATAQDGSGAKGECKVTVKEKDPETIRVTKITLNKTALQLEVGVTKKLTATVEPTDATNKTVEWKSDDDKIAAVDQMGRVTAIGVGNVTITAAATDDSGVSGQCAVTVIKQGTELPAMYLTTMMHGEMKIALAGSGQATINWGDGSEPGTVTLLAFDEKKGDFNDSQTYTHFYSDASVHNIVIEGQNVTHIRSYASNITEFDVSKNHVLKRLSCSFNKLTSLDVTQNSALIHIGCTGNQLTSLDVTENVMLTELLCNANMLTALDVSENIALESLQCVDNKLAKLDLTKNTMLTELSCGGNKLTSLDVTKNTKLTKLWCPYNQLTSLDVTQNTGLITFFCPHNQLKDLDISANIKMVNLRCNSNELTKLDVSNNAPLEELLCYNNQLTSLDVTKNTKIKKLTCFGNQLTGLDARNNTVLEFLSCAENQFGANELNALFGTLHGNTIEGGKTVYIGDNPGTADCDKSIATAKGWDVK